MMETRRTLEASWDNRTATPLDVLQVVVVGNHSIAPGSWFQPGEKLGKHYYEPSLCLLDSRTWKSGEINGYV